MATLRSRLIVFFLLFSIIPIVIFGSMEYYLQNIEIKEEVTRSFENETESLGISMRFLFDFRMEQLSNLTLDENIQSILLDYHVFENSDQNERVNSESVLKTLNEHTKTSGKDYHNIIPNFIGFYDYHLRASDGQILFDSDFDSAEKIPIDDHRFVTQLNSPTVSYHPDVQKNRSMEVSSPVYNNISDSPKVLGLLTATMGVSTTDHILIDSRKKNSDETYLVDMNKVMVSESRFIPDASFSVQVDNIAIRECVDNGRNYVGFYDDYRGIQIYGATYCARDLGFVLVHEIDSAELFLSLNKLIYESIAIIVILSSFAVLFGVLISKNILKPLNQLEDRTKEFTNEGLDIPIIKNSYAEINSLNKSFSFMAKTLKENQNILLKKEKLITIGGFASRMSHDIRNPLSIIRMTLENLKIMYGVDDSKRKQFDKIDRSISRIVHQIDGVLDYVRSNPLKLNKEELFDILDDSLDSLNIPSRIKLILPKNNVNILCDIQQFSVAISNLILNSIQDIDAVGTIEITCEENDDTIIIQIKDSGNGIPQENIDKLFDPLFTTKQQGTGLGLASVKSIIESHGGTISVTSPPTIFTITLPKKSEN